MKMYNFSSIMFVIVCLSSVNLLSLNRGPCRKREDLTPAARVNEAKPAPPTPVVVVEPPKPVGPQRVKQVPLNRAINLRNKATGYCLSAVIAHDAKYVMAVCNPADNKQQFTIKPKSGDWWQIFPAANGLVFDLAYADSKEGNFYWNWDINNTVAQNFKMPITNGYFSIINQNSNKCASNSSGFVVDQRSCANGDDKQLWYIQQ